MTIIRFIGDVHGKMDEYVKLTEGCEYSVQVGDFGAGFVDLPLLDCNYHMFIRGNHDSPKICQYSLNWLPDGIFLPHWNMFLSGGALSIDQHLRTEGVSWWRDEECSIAELNLIIAKYESSKPRIMITHDCPECLVEHLQGVIKGNFPSRTRQAFQTMWEIHKPDLWIFGHWHQSFTCYLGRTTFICLDELEYKDIDID